MKLTPERLAEIRARAKRLSDGLPHTVDAGAAIRDRRELLDHIDALEAEREGDPVRRFLGHERFVSLYRWEAWYAEYVINDDRNTTTVEHDTPGEACAAALRALEGSDGNG